MRKLVLLFIFINLFNVAYNQVIKGTVLDNETKSPIGFAYLYFNGTFTATQADQNGHYELDVSRNALMPLTISAIGYYSSTLNDFSPEKTNLIYLIPKLYELKEVIINANSLAKRKKADLRLFKNVFIGETDIAFECKILNESDITFNYGSDKDTLKAFASKPLLIDNKALGYKITYYLDRFEYIRKNKSFFYKGNAIFNEDLNTNERQKQSFEINRRYSYFGSRMHFFRALWVNDLKSEGFTVKTPSNVNLNYEDIVIQENSLRKFLKYPENVNIYYFTRLPIGHIVFLKERVYFDNSGYYDELGISWEGYLASQRVGDFLPYEYQVKE